MAAPRKYIWIGLIVVATGLYMASEAIDAYHTGTLVHVPHAPDQEWWFALAIAVLATLFGFLTVAAGFSWIKPRGERPME